MTTKTYHLRPSSFTLSTTSLTDLIQHSLDPEVEEGMNPSFLDCFGTVVVHELGDDETEFNFHENLNRTQHDIEAFVVDRYPQSEHGKTTIHLLTRLKNRARTVSPPLRKISRRAIPEDVISHWSTLSLRAHLTHNLEWLHRTTWDPHHEETMEVETTDIFQSLVHWAAETDGLIEEFVVLINGDTDEPSLAWCQHLTSNGSTLGVQSKPTVER